VADLFSGVGVFALRLAAAAQVFAADSDKAAIAALTEAVRRAPGLKPVEAKHAISFASP
jgi:23S rRNA (uracil1939-C5)-methyltransferase